MSEQLRITIPLPPAGSTYMRDFEKYFEANVPEGTLAIVKQKLDAAHQQFNTETLKLKQYLDAESSSVNIVRILSAMRAEQQKLNDFIGSAPLPPSIEEIASIIVLNTYFLKEDGDMIQSEMKVSIMKRFRSSFPNIDKVTMLLAQETLDNVFSSVQSFYTSNKICHDYMNGLAKHYSTFIPAHIGKNPVAGLDVYMLAEIEGAKLTPSEAFAMEETGRQLRASIA